MTTTHQTAFNGGTETLAHKKAAQSMSGSSSIHNCYSSTEGDFLSAMITAGLVPAERNITADGTMHRFKVEGDKSGSKNGWYVLFSDGVPSGAFGSWKLGINEKWCAVNPSSLTWGERAEQRQRIERAKANAADVLASANQDASEKAAHMYHRAQPAQPDHPYLIRKRVGVGFARRMKDALMLPIIDVNMRFAGLQFIQPDGAKTILSGTAKKGHFIPVANGSNENRFLICEGWATGMSLAATDPTANVLAAIDAGNLEPVAVAIRKRSPDADMTICCDTDRTASTNIGLIKGRAAAIAANAKIRVPKFPEGAPPGLSDFNDLANYLTGGSQ